MVIFPKEQLKKVFQRAFYTLDLDAALGSTVEKCHTCTSLQKIPSRFTQQSTSDPPAAIGIKFSADVIKDNGQKILLIREYTSSFTDALFVKSESAEDLRCGLIKLISKLCSPNGPSITIRTDPHTSFQSLAKDQLLANIPIALELGNPKNVNKNPVSENAIAEFRKESARLQPSGGPISEITLCLIIQRMNSKIRSSGLTALEVLTKRDMTSGNPIKVDDNALIQLKQKERTYNHAASAKYKGRGKTSASQPKVHRGDIVYIIPDKVKGQCRDQYLVISVSNTHAEVQKLLNNRLRPKTYEVRLSELLVVSQDVPNPAVDSSDDEL